MKPMERLTTGLASHRFAVDVATTMMLALVLVPSSFALYQGVGQPGIGATPVWALLLVAPLAWRRVRPVAAAAAVYLVGLGQVVAGPLLVFPADVVLLVALYSVTVYGPRWAGRLAMGSVLAGSAAFVVRAIVETGLGDGLVTGGAFAVMLTASGLATFAFALLRRAREDRLAILRERADRLEREREQQDALAAAAERARIAREMHDVVAHSLSVVVAQADGGRYAAHQEPEAAVRALGTISETGRAALADMRRILGVLRTGAEADDDGRLAGGEAGTGADRHGDDMGATELGPQPTTGDLEALVDQVRVSGLRVSLVRLGPPRMLPPGMALTVYRICQEALTNVIKHAGPDASVTLLQQWGPTSLVLEIRDDGRGAAAAGDGAGYGLAGMRERVLLFGGTITAGPRPGGGFRVHVELPLPADGNVAPYGTPTRDNGVTRHQAAPPRVAADRQL